MTRMKVTLFKLFHTCHTCSLQLTRSHSLHNKRKDLTANIKRRESSILMLWSMPFATRATTKIEFSLHECHPRILEIKLRRVTKLDQKSFTKIRVKQIFCNVHKNCWQATKGECVMLRDVCVVPFEHIHARECWEDSEFSFGTSSLGVFCVPSATQNLYLGLQGLCLLHRTGNLGLVETGAIAALVRSSTGTQYVLQILLCEYKLRLLNVWLRQPTQDARLFIQI